MDDNHTDGNKQLHITAFSASDRQAVVALFEAAQATSCGAYPPLQRTRELGGVEPWLDFTTKCNRLVIRDKDTLLAHIESESLPDILARSDPADDYWQRAFRSQKGLQADLPVHLDQLVLIRRLLVAPACRNLGLGRQLLRHVVEEIKFSPGKVGALVVLTNLEEVIGLYEAEGAVYINTFTGHNQRSLHSYIV